jgi:predicted NBD/HSP70 family sugar kinase
MSPAARRRPRRVLVLDVGGTHVKVALSHHPGVLRIPSGPGFTPEKMVKQLSRRIRGKHYDAVAIGYPGLVLHGRVVREPHNLGKGWVGYNFEKALGRPTRVVNDAAMQTIGCYRGGSVLFLGLGAGLGTAMIVDGKVEPMELAHLPYKKGRTYEEYVGEAGLRRLGHKRWQKEVFEVVKTLSAALEPDYVAIGGGNVRKLTKLPPNAERWDNSCAIKGGVRLWKELEGDPSGGSGRVSPDAATGRRRVPARRGLAV